MNSPHTGKRMRIKESKVKVDYKGESFEINYSYYYCPASDERYTDDRLDDINLYEAYQLYQEKHNLKTLEFDEFLIHFGNK